MTAVMVVIAVFLIVVWAVTMAIIIMKVALRWSITIAVMVGMVTIVAVRVVVIIRVVIIRVVIIVRVVLNNNFFVVVIFAVFGEVAIGISEHHCTDTHCEGGE